MIMQKEEKMNSKMKLIGILLGLLLMTGLNIGHAQEQAYDPTKKYSVEQLKEDLLYTKASLEIHHPGLYTHIDKVSFDKLCDSLLQEIQQPMTEFEFFPFVQLLLAKVSEKHTSVWLSKSGSSYMYNEVKKLPFKLKYINGSLYIHQNGSSDSSLVKGTEIISINDRTSDDILAEMLPQLISDGLNETSKYRMDIESSFSKYYYLLIDQKEEFKLVVKKPKQGQKTEVVVSGVTGKVFNKIVAALYPQPKEEPFQLEVMENEQTAVFTNNGFLEENSDGKDDIKFNKYAFKQLKNNPKITNLIIDVRKNPGGDPRGTTDLISYLTNEDIQLYKKIEMNEKIVFFKEDGQGKYYAPKYIRSWRPDFKKDCFAGNIYILTSGNTHSVAGFFAALMSYHTNAVMVGEETGGGFYVATGGKNKFIDLENTQLRMVIPTIRFFTNVSGQPEGRGTLPDHEVTQTYEDFMTDTDTEIEFVLELIKKGKDVK